MHTPNKKSMHIISRVLLNMIIYIYIRSFDDHGWITDVSSDGRNATGGPANPSASVGGDGRFNPPVGGFGFFENLFNGFRLIQHRIHSSDPIELRTSAHVLLQCLLSFPTLL